MPSPRPSARSRRWIALVVSVLDVDVDMVPVPSSVGLGHLCPAMALIMLNRGEVPVLDEKAARTPRSARPVSRDLSGGMSARNGQRRRGEPGALLDRPFGVQFGGHFGAADQVNRPIAPSCSASSRTGSCPAQTTTVSTSSTRGRSCFGRREVQAFVVDPLVVDAGQLLDALGLQRRPVHPAAGLAKPLADAFVLALQQVHLARRRHRARLRSAAPGASDRTPHSARHVVAGPARAIRRCVRNSLTSTPMPPAPITATSLPRDRLPLATTST